MPGSQLEQETVQAFQALDNAEEQGWLDVKQIVEMLTTMGHKMKKTEAMALIDVSHANDDSN